MEYSLAFYSFIGRRSENQDAILEHKISNDSFLVGIADGMGGMTGGRLASHAALDSVLKYIRGLGKNDVNENNMKAIMANCFQFANQRMIQEIALNPQLEGMGTTMCLLLIYKDKFVWGNIGDSRLYKINDSGVKLITNDHSYIHEHYTRHNLEVPESVLRQYGHYLTRCIDGNNSDPDVYPSESDFEMVEANSYFLLCTDGLILDKGTSEFDYIRSIVLGEKDINTKVNELISFAFNEGSTDNIASALVKAVPGNNKFLEATDLSKSGRNKFKKISFIALIIFVLVAGSIAIFKMYFDKTINTEVVGNESTKIGFDDRSSFWTPLEQEEYQTPLDKNSRLLWKPYPDINAIKGYRLIIENDTESLRTDFVDRRKFYIPVDDLELLPEKRYKLTINAILISEEELVGNTIYFTIIND